MSTQAVLTMGLPPESRTMMALTGRSVSTEALLLAGILDQLRLQTWRWSKASKNNQNRPKSILSALLEKPEKEDEVLSFGSGEDFISYREALLKEGKNG